MKLYITNSMSDKLSKLVKQQDIFTSLKDLALFIKTLTKEDLLQEKFIIYEPLLISDNSLQIDKIKFISVLSKNSSVYLILDRLNYDKLNSYYKEGITKIFIKDETEFDYSYLSYMLKMNFTDKLNEILLLDNVNMKDNLKVFIENITTISYDPLQLKYILDMKSNILRYALTYMNSTASFNETINSLNEKIAELEKLNDVISELKTKLKEKEDELNNRSLIEQEKDSKLEKYEGLIKIYSDKLESKINEFFIPIKLFLEKKEYKKILYFKEYDYVNYSFTFLRLLQAFLKSKGGTCRFVIYDNLSNQLRGTYYTDFYKFQPVQLQHSEELMKKFDKFYVNEPREEITKKMIFENPADYTIIWDRTYNRLDILEDSPNLVKFHLTNSLL